MNDDVIRYRRFAQERAEQLALEEEGLRRWLVKVRLGGWPLLVLSLVSPVAAGSLSLTGAFSDSYPWLVPVLSFVGAAAIALHKGLNCEKYQEGLKRAAQTVRSITEDFEGIVAIPDDEVPLAFQKAEARLRDMRATSNDLPPSRRRAEAARSPALPSGI